MLFDATSVVQAGLKKVDVSRASKYYRAPNCRLSDIAAATTSTLYMRLKNF